MQDYSRPMMDFVVLKFGILIAKRLFNMEIAYHLPLHLGLSRME